MTDVPQQPPQQPPGTPYQGAPVAGTPPTGPPPGWGQGQPTPPAYAAPPRPNPLQTTSPRTLMALALLIAGAIHLFAILVLLVTLDGDFIDRLANSFDGVDLRAMLLLPLALLLARGTDDDAPPATGLNRTVVLGITILAAAFTVFAAIGLLAHLGEDTFEDDIKFAQFFFDVARLLLGLGATWWAFRELQRAGGIPAGMPGGPPSQQPPQYQPPPQQWTPPPTHDPGQTTAMPPQPPGYQQPGYQPPGYQQQQPPPPPTVAP